MSRFTFTPLPLTGLHLVQRQRLSDSRGELSRIFCAWELAPIGWTQPIAQITHTRTVKRGTVRGLHYQNVPHAESKLVSCTKGEVWDVAVDLRPDSVTFLQWHAQHLVADHGDAMLIPQGFAHGFQALTDDVELLYCHSAAHAPLAEAGIHPLEPLVAIGWPLPVTDLSSRDASHAWLTADFEGVHP